MAYIPTFARAMRAYSGPRCIVFSSSEAPPIPGYRAKGSKRADDEPDEEQPRGDGNKRAIREFSRSSALSIARLLSSIDWERHGECLHVTLTYGQQYPDSKEELAGEKSQLVALLGRKCVGIWRLEFQARGAPHWHVLAWVPPERVDAFSAWVCRWWSRRTDNLTRYGAQITQGRAARAAWYLALHSAKGSQAKAPFPPGRWWGYIQRAKFLEAVDVQDAGRVEHLELVWLKRLYRRKTGSRAREGQGFCWFLPREWQSRVVEWIHSEGFRPSDPF